MLGVLEISRPPVWHMVKEAVESLGHASRREIVDYIKGKYGDVKESTIQAHITLCCVNHPSRIHYPQNKRPRDCSTLANRHDILFATGDGKFEIYDPEKHGRWLIVEKDGRPRVRGPLGILEPRHPVVIEPTRKHEVPIESPLSLEDLGNFYILISSFERELRVFIKEMLGKSWIKRLECELPDIVNRWKDRKKRDKKWGIDPEEELINYADLGDYIQIIRRYRRVFVESDDELSDVITQLKIFANYGRNPVMHCRSIDRRKYYTSQSAVKYLREWIRRRKKAYIDQKTEENHHD